MTEELHEYLVENPDGSVSTKTAFPSEAKKQNWGTDLGTIQESQESQRELEANSLSGIGAAIIFSVLIALVIITIRGFNKINKSIQIMIIGYIILFIGVSCIGGPLIGIGVTLIAAAIHFFSASSSSSER